MSEKTTESVQQAQETYLIAAALGSPLDAPVGSVVYRVTVHDVDWLDLDTTVNSQAKAEQIIIDAAKRRFKYLSHFHDTTCSKCERQALLHTGVESNEFVQAELYFVCQCGNTWQFPFKRETLTFTEAVEMHRAAACKTVIQKVILQ